MAYRFQTFRGRILAFVVGLLVLVQGTAMLLVHAANLSGARRHVDEALALTANAFRRSLEIREQILVEKARLLSSDFAFKAVAATGDRATVLSALRNHSARVGADVMMLLEPSGAVVANTLRPGAEAEDPAVQLLLDEAQRDEFGEASSLQVLDGAPYQLVAVPLFSPEPSSWIVIGFQIRDALARQLQAETGTHVSLLRREAGGWSAFATTLPPAAREALERNLGQLPAGRPEIIGLDLDGDPYVSWIERMDEAGIAFVAVLQRSLDEALLPFLRLRGMLLIIFAAGLGLSLLGGVLLAGRVTRPVADLARAARRIEAGNYAEPVRVEQRDELGALAGSFNAMMKGLDERDQVRDLLGRVVAPQIAEELLSKRIELGGEERRVTVLFADIRGFTHLSEREEPQRLVRTLNTFLTAASRAVESHGGVVEEYLGDGAKALFGAPVAHPDDAERAVRAGLALTGSMHDVNREVQAFGGAPLAIGVGINTADVVAGRMGSLSRLKYTVVGDGVNLASRLEGLTRRYDVPLIVSASTRDLCPSLVFRELDRVRVRGRVEPVVIYEPLGPAEGLDPAVLEIAARHDAALERLRARDWDAAAEGFEQLHARQPEAALYRLYLERIRRLRQDPPDADWDGTAPHDER